MSESFIKNVNKLAETIDKNIANIDEMLEKIKQIEQEITTRYNTIISTGNSVAQNATSINEKLNTQATTNKLGTVKIATNLNTDDNKVITVQALKEVLHNINTSLQPATSKVQGIIKIATNEEVINQTGNNAITPENIKYAKLNLDTTNYYSHTIFGTVNFIIFDMGNGKKYLNGFGRIEGNNKTTVKILFPKPIINSSFGAGISTFKNNKNSILIIEELTSEYVVISFRNEINELTNVAGTISLQALIDDGITPIAPMDVKGTAEGNKITLTWED